MIPIAFGLLSAIKHRFRGIGWLFPLVLGGIFLFDKASPDINLRPYIWPIILIAAGLFIIFRPKGRRHCGFQRDDDPDTQTNAMTTNQNEPFETTVNDGNDSVDIVAIFGGVKKNILSKSFRGGDIVAIMGGAEINLTQADFNGRVSVDCFNMFGGTKLIIPADWEVQSDVVAIFGGVDDKRPPSTNPAPNKILYLEGTCLFGGLEIKSY
jgi:predicted membrane protein